MEALTALAAQADAGDRRTAAKVDPLLADEATLARRLST